MEGDSQGRGVVSLVRILAVKEQEGSCISPNDDEPVRMVLCTNWYECWINDIREAKAFVKDYIVG
jgi:hypothetical protein